HATVQRFPFLVRDLDGAELVALRDAGRRLAALGPITLDFDAPAPAGDAVVVRARVEEDWGVLSHTVRDAAALALGDEARRYGPPFGPHMTLAYGTATGHDADVHSALGAEPDAAAQLGVVTFAELAWCAVQQNRDAGTYTFEVLFTSPFVS
ncbi:MAG: hypothetical protein QM602_05775, partial [Microbacterium sp.]